MKLRRGLTHIPPAFISGAKLRTCRRKSFHGSLKGDKKGVLRHGSANTQDRFVKQEPVKQRFHFQCPFLQLGRRGLGIGACSGCFLEKGSLTAILLRDGKAFIAAEAVP